MDDDFAFGGSVWDTPTDTIDLVPSASKDLLPSASKDLLPSASKDPLPSIASLPAPDDVQFDDFDDFGPSTQAQDDDFGDFGDFGDVQDLPINTVFDQHFQSAAAGPSYYQSSWEPLQLDPMPSKDDLTDQVNSILGPAWDILDIESYTTNEGLREVGGISQILPAAESRDLYNMLLQTPPPIKPPNWTRSRIRRQHLIALGIPVNLDEVLMSGKVLPTLQVTTRPMSAPPGPRNFAQQANPTSTGNSRAGTPNPSHRQPAQSFGDKPELDHAKISELLNSDEDMPLLPVSVLERHLTDLRKHTAEASGLLTYLLQTREALQQNSETYNKLIADLVGEAQRQKSGKGKGTPSRKASGM